MVRWPWIEYRADILAESEPPHVNECLRTELTRYRCEPDSLVFHPSAIRIDLPGNPTHYMATGRRYGGEMG